MTIGIGTFAAAAALIVGGLGLTQATPKQQANPAPPHNQLAPPAAISTPGPGQGAAMPSAQRPEELQRRVTRSFTTAPLSEVLKWLSGEGVNFVANESDFTGDAKLTINIANQPIGDAMDAIADAFDARWTRHGNVYTLQRGSRILLPPVPPGPMGGIYPPMGETTPPAGEMNNPPFPGETPPGGITLPRDSEGAPFVWRSQELGKLVQSLTASQRAKQTRRGYLTLADLTPDQAGMLGTLPPGRDWSITYVIGKSKLILRGK